MEDSILTSIKKLLGIDADYHEFDDDIVMHINTVFMILYQEGVCSTPFSITGTPEIWSDFLGTNADLEGIKTYMYLRVQAMFDPPTSSAVATAKEAIWKELEWRLYSTANFKEEETTT